MVRSKQWFDLAPLRQPAWWAALALLLVNDNLLKGRGVAPGWLTGKLSDFAFLVVAPVVFAALLPRMVPARRLIALLSVVGVYVAADLSRDFSDAVVAVAARVGLTWRLWPDPSDLVALGVLPLTVHLLYRATTTSWPVFDRLRERTGVVLGAVACLATSAPPSWVHKPFLFNATAGPANVRVTWLLRDSGNYSCVAPESLAATLNANDLDDARELQIESGQVAALDGPTPAGMSPVGMCEQPASPWWGCVAAILEAPPAAPVLMVVPARWNESESGGFISCSSPPSPVSKCEPRLDPKLDPGPDALTLKDVDGERRFVAGEKLSIVPVDLAAIAARTPDPNGCRAIRAEYRTAVSSSSCAVDTECTGRPGEQIPDEPFACAIYVSATNSTAIDDLGARWERNCMRSHTVCGDYPQPAVCQGGRCAAACPDVVVPSCAAYCAGDPPTVGSSCYPSTYDCRRADERLCQCVDGGIACAIQPPAGPNCPFRCINFPGGGTLDRSKIDGGAGTDAASPVNDAGSVDAGDAMSAG